MYRASKVRSFDAFRILSNILADGKVTFGAHFQDVVKQVHWIAGAHAVVS